MGKGKKKWHECNVVRQSDSTTQLWHFNASERRFALKSKFTERDENPLPGKLVGKTWQNLLQGKLNIAWLPEGQVFLRTIQMPECEPEELRDMLEFQLEKLSPAPVNQVAWSYELIPSAAEGQVTVLLIIVDAAVVETKLGELEAVGYQTDRLEVPWCHELATLERGADAVWIRLEERGSEIVLLVAWVIKQTLQNVMVMRLPNSDEGTLSLTEQLDRTTWTGELEGWLSVTPPLTLCGDAETIGPWRDALKAWSAHEVQTSEPPSSEALATLGARRAARSDSQADLLPEAHRVRYRQQYVDGMWMKGVGFAVMLYIFGVLIYFVRLEWMHRDNITVQTQLRSMSLQYTNVLKMQAKMEILQEQIDLKFSALECLRIISEELPTELTLDTFNFQKGKTLSLYGKVATLDQNKVTEYHAALISARIGEQPLFAAVSDPSITAGRGRGRSASTDSRWSFNCELARSGF